MPIQPPPQGALSQLAPPPQPPMPPAPPPAPGQSPVNVQIQAPGGGALGGGLPGPAPGPAAPAAAAGPPVKPPKPGNEGLINRVLGMVSGETQQKQRMEHQQQLAEALKQGAAQALQGVVGSVASIHGPEALRGDPTATIRSLMAQSAPGSEGLPQGLPQGLARGGYPFQYLASRPGLPIRESFATGGGHGSFVPPNGMSGRSDQVEARLSPNEYVMDAETVSALGDGSPDAGAKKLDKFRSNIRRHKGKALAKGKFSPDAREPESYL